MIVAASTKTLAVSFGEGGPSSAGIAGDAGVELRLHMPVLGGESFEIPFSGGGEIRSAGDFRIIRSEGFTAGCVLCRSGSPIEWDVYKTYRELFEILGDHALYRAWNYVPHINARTEGLESYRSFNIGRYRAFEEAFGQGFEEKIPAASALGIEEDVFALAFVAGSVPVRHFENPEQMPAYRYPADYGPKSPSFTRGSVAEIGGRRTGFVSGTSSVKGHETVSAGDFDAQFAVTINNLRLISETMGFADALERDSCFERAFKLFVRHENDAEQAMRALAGVVGDDAAASTPLIKADICRSDLLLEIEAIYRA